jgi:hypothetical protein
LPLIDRSLGVQDVENQARNFSVPRFVSCTVGAEENLIVRNPFNSMVQAAALAAFVVVGGASCNAQDSGFSLDLHANAHATAKDIGLPVYPGATPWKDKDNDSAANLGFGLNAFHFSLLVASYASSDSPARVLDYYRKPLSRYGEVLECYKGKPVGALTVTHSGLTCSASKGENIEVNGNSSTDHELRAGTPLRFRIVGIGDAQDGKTRFGLVYIELPKDSDSKD